MSRPQIMFTHTESGVSDTLRFDSPNEKDKGIWKTFLRDFENHLKRKGWLEKTYLSFHRQLLKVYYSLHKTEIILSFASDIHV